MANDRKDAHIELCLGYYDAVGEPKIINPYRTGDPFPELTQVHESVHRELAEANSTNSLTRIFSPILELGEDVLPKRIVTGMRQLLSVLNEHIQFAHESLATYLSCWAFYPQEEERIADAISRMPERYRAAYEAAVMAFGSLEEASQEPYSRFLPVISLGVGIAALNLDYSAWQTDIGNLEPLIETIMRDSPDHRFATFLKHIAPPSEPGLLMKLVEEAVRDRLDESASKRVPQPDQPYSEIQLRLFRAIRASCPDVSILPDRVRSIAWWHGVVDALRAQIRDLGLDFADQLVVTPRSAETERTEAKLSSIFLLSPDLPEWFPLDASLASIDFRSVRQNAFEDVVGLCTRGACEMQVLVLSESRGADEGSSPADSRAAQCLVACLLRPAEGSVNRRGRRGSVRDLSPCVTRIGLASLDRILTAARGASIVLKSDERDLPLLEPYLRKWGMVTVVLPGDTRLTHLLEVASSMTGRGEVVVCMLNLTETGKVIVLRERHGNLYYCAPTNQMEMGLFESHFDGDPRVLFAARAEEADKYGIAVTELWPVLETCFGL